jgi:hypothetical protein
MRYLKVRAQRLPSLFITPDISDMAQECFNYCGNISHHFKIGCLNSCIDHWLPDMDHDGKFEVSRVFHGSFCFLSTNYRHRSLKRLTRRT